MVTLPLLNKVSRGKKNPYLIWVTAEFNTSRHEEGWEAEMTKIQEHLQLKKKKGGGQTW